MATKDYERAAEQMMKANGAKCPTATQDITVNLKNRGKAIDSAAYGPENPALPNKQFWMQKAKDWEVSEKDAKTALCGNCSAFNQEKSRLDCIATGIGDEGDPWARIEAGDLGEIALKEAGGRKP